METAEIAEDLFAPPKKTFWQKLRTELRYIPIFPLIAIIIFLICGIFGEVLAPHEPNLASFGDSLAPPFFMKGGSIKYVFGTDHLGRDVLSRIIVGAGTSLQVGVMVVILCGFIGAAIGISAGYFGGVVDAFFMRLVDMMISLPFLVLAITLAAILGASKYNLIIILAIIGWAWYARVLRADVLKLKEADFVRLAIVGGCGKVRIMFYHIFPNIVNSLVILATLNLGVVIIAEASLSFLGLGVPPPDPTWGLMVADGRNYINQAWWLCTFPGLAILFVVLSFNILGDWLRVRLDPKFRQTII